MFYKDFRPQKLYKEALQNTFFRGMGGGGQFSWGTYFRGVFFPGAFFLAPFLQTLYVFLDYDFD